MSVKALPIAEEKIREIAGQHPTPFYLYDERGMRENARRLNAAFDWCPGFCEYFAVKATPNPHIVKLLNEEGCGADCSSTAELEICDRIGVSGEQIMFTSNETPATQYERAKQLGAIINLDDISHIEYLEQSVGLPELLCFRFNPGPERTGNVIIGNPSEAKYGLTRPQLMEAYQTVRNKGVKRFGLHTMVASNELNRSYFVETARMLFEIACELKTNCGIGLEFVNLGGGIGIPYKPEDEPIDLAELGQEIHQLYNEMITSSDVHPLKIFLENGRVMTGPYGILVTEAIHEKHIYKDYIGVDACMSNLMRPGMYGAYHHITVLGKNDAPHDHTYDVVGSLCENNDKFAIDRRLPKIERGDLLVIHDAGAHGHAMGFQYNGKLRSAELLLKADGSVQQIRRAERLDDYFATLDFASV